MHSMQRVCGQQRSLRVSLAVTSRAGPGTRALHTPAASTGRASSASLFALAGAARVAPQHLAHPRNVSAAVSLFQHEKAVAPSAENEVIFDAEILYYDPWADLSALDCDWSITKLVDKETGNYAPQNTVSGYVDKAQGVLDVRTTKVSVPAGFQPGAVVLTAKDGLLVKGRHAFIHKITLKPVGGGPELVFPANTYISASQGERIIFEGIPLLRSQTPKGLGQLRDAELTALKGGPPSLRMGNERVYQYDVYDDLGGDPSNTFARRPALGGSAEFPYPRRIRTGRPLYPTMDPPTETSGGIPWLPLDDGFNDQKSINFLSNAIASLVPIVVDKLISAVLKNDSTVFADIKSVLSLYYDTPAEVKPQSGKGSDAPDLARVIGDIVEDVLRGNFIAALVPDLIDGGKDGLLARLKDLLLQATRFALPLVLQDRLGEWERDEELGRQLLAGQNPLTIVALKSQADLDGLTSAGSSIPANEAAFKNLLEGKSLSQLVGLPKPRLFVVDHAAVIEDYLPKVNNGDIQSGALHAARGLFYLRDTGYLVPVAIEMKSDKAQPFTVYTPNMPKPIWRLCKAIFSSCDSGSHQLVSHWLRTHCCVEPYLIATRRCLSVMHPVFKLMMPHFRYTMAINAAARALLINKDGVIEKGFTPGRYSMELSSKVYAADWQFDEQGLPADLKKRGLMTPEGELLVDDYPYAQDGLLIWNALESYFTNYLGLYYSSDADVASDAELQGWWEDIRGPSGGHADKANSPGWPELSSISNLVFALATIAWSASAHHAAVNFDQYDYSGFMPNRASAVVKTMPLPGSDEFKKLGNQAPGSDESQKEFLSYLSPLPTTLQVMAVLKLLSSHSNEEQYLLADQASLGWLTDDRVSPVHDKFLEALQAAADEINRRNSSGDYKTRSVGDCGVPYTLMLPTSDPGVTGRGVPYSISI